MTLGILLPLVCVFAALAELAIFLNWRSSGRISEGVFPLLAIASLLFPIAVYAILKYAIPDVGAMTVF